MLGVHPCLLLLITTIHASQKIDLQSHKRLIVDLHNEYRRRENGADMMYMDWDETLASEASAWTKRCKFLHQENEYGENIAYDINEAKPDAFLKRILRLWYDERMRYYRSPYGCRNSCHYTQMIWSETTSVGCAMSQCKTLQVWGQHIENAIYLVCYYTPRGKHSYLDQIGLVHSIESGSSMPQYLPTRPLSGNWIGQYPFLSGTTCSRCPRGHWCNKGLCKNRDSPIITQIHTKTSLTAVDSSGATADEAVVGRSELLTVAESNTGVQLRPGPMSGRENLDEKFENNDESGSCEDLQKVMCQEWSRQGECERNQDAMVHYCKRSCGLCPRESSNVIIEGTIDQNDEMCEDTYESRQCQVWATVGECEINPVSMQHYCKRSCGLCNPMAKGFNLDTNYTPIKDETDTATVLRKTADKGGKKKKKKCKDTFTKKKCNYMYSMGMCKVRHLQKWMKSNCGKTCGFCLKRKYKEALVRKVGNCQDRKVESKCQRLKDKGYCVTKKKKMRRKCAVTCGLCEDEPT